MGWIFLERGEKTPDKDNSDDFELNDDINDNIYSEDVRESLLDNDELSPAEEAFMRGYEEAIE